LNTLTWTWESPIAYPGGVHDWDENTQSWVNRIQGNLE
jgi:hypothetical protein